MRTFEVFLNVRPVFTRTPGTSVVFVAEWIERGTGSVMYTSSKGPEEKVRALAAKYLTRAPHLVDTTRRGT